MELINELNEILYNKNIFNMQFTVLTDGDTQIYYLNEIREFGWEIRILNTDGYIDEDLEDAYEENQIEYNQLVIEQIKRNLVTVIQDIQAINLSLS